MVQIVDRLVRRISIEQTAQPHQHLTFSSTRETNAADRIPALLCETEAGQRGGISVVRPHESDVYFFLIQFVAMLSAIAPCFFHLNPCECQGTELDFG